MEAVSKYILLKDPEPNAFDTNIVSLNLSCLKKWADNISKEDPIPCELCFSVHTPFDTNCGNPQDLREHLEQFIFSSTIKPKLISPISLEEPKKTKKKSNLSSQKFEEKKVIKKNKKNINSDNSNSEDEGDGTPKEIPFKRKENFLQKGLSDAFSRNTFYWLCSFCGHPNEMKKRTREQRKHKAVDTFFMLKQSNDMNIEEDISVIFCLDNSGSMCSTLEVPAGTFSSKILNEQEIEMLKRALPGESLQLDQGNPGAFQPARAQYTHVSRKNCITKAIQKELNKMRMEFPHRKVGVVIFNDDVVITGDGFSHKKMINGINLLDYKKCLEIGKDSKHMMSKKVSESFLTVVKPYEESPEKGKTALCPALVTAVGLASTGKPGSMVILCTDGLANVGFGDLAIGNNEEKKPYEDIAKFALDSGISINVVTIMGEQSRMDVLGALANKTNGNVDRINPSVINNEFNQMLNDNLLGRNALLTAFLPNFLKFTDENADNLFSGGSICKKEIGNISETTKISLRYCLKDYVFDRKRKQIEEGENVLLQMQMKFLSMEGCQVIRVASCEIPVTFNEETAYAHANIGLLANHAAFDAAESAVDKRLQRQACWNNLMEDIRETKRKKDVMNKNDEESLSIYRADARHLEEMTVNVRKKANKPTKALGRPFNNGNKNNTIKEEEDDQLEEERTFALKMKKRNYNR